MSPMSRKSKDGSNNVTDEVFNTTSHMIGVIFFLIGGVWLIISSSLQKDPFKIVSFSLYTFGLIGLFLASTLHHGLPTKKKAAQIFQILDYSAIFLLIAGSLTPLCLVTLRGPFGWMIFGVTWFFAILGIVLKASFPKLPKWVTNTLYVSLGWIGAILAIPLVTILPLNAIILLAAGGIIYTIGSFIFLHEKPNFVPGKFGFHELWHIFVLVGAFLHWLMMYWYVL
jgi:hemolysin III